MFFSCQICERKLKCLLHCQIVCQAPTGSQKYRLMGNPFFFLIPTRAMYRKLVIFF
jgi:hypothetical protein